MVRTSLHLLLGTLAIRRGAVVECVSGSGVYECLADWGLGDDYQVGSNANLTGASNNPQCGRMHSWGCPMEILPGTGFSRDIKPNFRHQGIDLVVPMVVRGEITGLVLLGGKASGEPFHRTI